MRGDPDRTWWERHARRFRKHAGFITAAVLGQVLVRSFVPEDVLRSANEVGGNFLQTFGGMYGIILAFAMYVVWQQHNETQVAVEREAVSLTELYRILGWFGSWKGRDAVRASLKRYATLVPETVGHEPTEAERRLIAAGLAEFLGHAPATPTEVRLFEPALELFHELNEAREHRITIARLRLPEGLRWFVYIGGVLGVSTLWLLYVDAWLVQALFTAVMTWVVVATVSIIVDLDDPYSGDFIVDWKRFREAAAQMEAPPPAGP